MDAKDVAECKFFSPRKIGLADAGMRQSEDDRTAVIITPGGYGTLDELFEFLTLKQLRKLGTKYPVPILLLNYDDFYDPLLQYIDTLAAAGMISPEDRDLLIVCRSNEEALDALADFYDISMDHRTYVQRITSRRETAEVKI